MRLYLVEEVGLYNNDYFYWAENEGDALDEHEAQVNQPDIEWVASPVWANNRQLELRGFVTQGGKQ